MPDIARNRIEIWRSEVESQTSSQSGMTGDVGWNAPVVQPPSFWRRIFGLGYGGSGNGSGGSGSGNQSGSGKNVSIARKIGLVKGEIERTGMYTVRSRDKDESGKGGGLEGKGANGDRNEGSSMGLDGTEESGRARWLRERKNRLERAAKLLRKNEGTGENGRRS
ncbi:hypothetical protein SBOR_4280 [Sclerotinia borealis F-4128]|uniref:Uncharacterized protein n=1 Tax=Sclerotinia borealis (strain F-4128) TaxID=1432307 RepID=W9CHN0_SCLBF|nr:hypothetical protein SBOR_4280 [Sclerotinia borealis F-4128]